MQKIVSSPLDIIFDNLFMSLEMFIPNNKIFLKLEGFSISGSIKIKSAINMINELEKSGRLKSGGTIIESSSGNLGVALGIISAVKGYKFICVVDPNILSCSEILMKAYGVQIIKITKKDNNGGYLSSRINFIKNEIQRDPKLVWVNQYENTNNIEAHYNNTAPPIIKNFPRLDYIFIGAGTTGTLSGVSDYIRKHSPKTQIIAVDSKGSVTFDGVAGKRLIPGLGASVVPPISKRAKFDRVIYVEEIEAIKVCSELARKGMLFGGSTGSVLAAIKNYQHVFKPNSTIVAISPDMGERYLNTIYNASWISENFPDLEHEPIRKKMTFENEYVYE